MSYCESDTYCPRTRIGDIATCNCGDHTTKIFCDLSGNWEVDPTVACEFNEMCPDDIQYHCNTGICNDGLCSDGTDCLEREWKSVKSGTIASYDCTLDCDEEVCKSFGVINRECDINGKWKSVYEVCDTYIVCDRIWDSVNEIYWPETKGTETFIKYCPNTSTEPLKRLCNVYGVWEPVIGSCPDYEDDNYWAIGYVVALGILICIIIVYIGYVIYKKYIS